MDDVPQSQNDVAPKKNISQLTWLDVDELSRYVSETGKILSRQYTRLSAKDQRQVAKLIKRARNMLRLQ